MLAATLVALLVAHWVARGPVAQADDESQAVAATAAPVAAAPRIVWLGATLVEREQVYGYVETRLTALATAPPPSFRNLGYSGDTVWGDARAGFDTAAEGFARLVEQVEAAQPSEIVIAYGANEAFAGAAGLDAFIAGYERLLDALAPTGARFVLVTPLPYEPLGPPLPDGDAYNEQLALYSAAIRHLAAQRECRLVDLFASLKNHPRRGPAWTENGLHPTAYGYWQLAEQLLAEVDVSAPPAWHVALAADGEIERAEGTTLSDVLVRTAEDPGPRDDGPSAHALVRFVATDAALPRPLGPCPTCGPSAPGACESERCCAPAAGDAKAICRDCNADCGAEDGCETTAASCDTGACDTAACDTAAYDTGACEAAACCQSAECGSCVAARYQPRRLVVRGLPPGQYALMVDGVRLTTGTSDEWAAGRPLPPGPEQAQVEALRAAIVAKNQLFFHRWRPQNETYLFGFRKHEQGQNAAEVPQFDPLIEAAQLDIARLCEPQAHIYELVPEPETDR